MAFRARAFALTLLGASVLLSHGGCAGSRESHARAAPGAFEAPAGSYAAWFDAAKEELRAAGFELARVDAQEGVVTTAPRASAGFATPWTGVESTFGQAFEGTMNALRRTAEVRFRSLSTEAPGDLRGAIGPFAGVVTVEIARASHPDTRISAVSIRLTNRSEGPRSAAPQGASESPPRLDEPLADRLAKAIEARAARTTHPIVSAP